MSVMMENWFIILLAVLAVIAVTLLLFFSMPGDDIFFMRRRNHRCGEYVNDQTAIISQSIIDAKSVRQAYLLFMEYIFTNHKQFLRYVSEMTSTIGKSYDMADVESLRVCLSKIADMKVELKDQKATLDKCMDSIDSAYIVESSSWVQLATELRFAINDSLRRLTKACIQYLELYSFSIPEDYSGPLQYLVEDICNVCKSSEELLAEGDVDGMRELRIRIAIIKSDSYDIAQRLYELLHDGRSTIEPDRHLALSYALNAFQECHCIVYALRRLVLCNLCLTLYSTKAVDDYTSSEAALKCNL